MRKLLTASILFFSMLQFLSAQMLEVRIKNIRELKGQLCVAIFTNEADFEVEKTFWKTKYKKELVVQGDLQIKIPLKPGKYGLSILDDENETGKMEYRLFGIPREGFGFSNYTQKGIRKPTFDDFSFVLEKNEIKHIIVIMKYF